jgi:hypothetical protein
MLNEFAYAQGVNDGMVKFAISRLRQHARNLTQAASRSQNPAAIAHAQEITSRAYKPRILGTGQEGTATLHMLPQASEGGALTPTVRKVFDPNAELASPELIRRRIALGPELNRTGDFAKYYGHGKTPGGRQYIESEYIPKQVAKGTNISRDQARIDRSLRAAGMRTGMGHLTAKDIHAGNLMINPKTGKAVAIDYMPMLRKEVMDPRFNRLYSIPETAPLPTHAGAQQFLNLKDLKNQSWDPTGEHRKRMESELAMAQKIDPRSLLPRYPVRSQNPRGKTVVTPRPPVSQETPSTPTPEGTAVGILPNTLISPQIQNTVVGRRGQGAPPPP